MFKRILCIGLTVSILLAFAGCASKTQTKTSTTEPYVLPNLSSEMGSGSFNENISPVPYAADTLRKMVEECKNYGESYLSNREVKEVSCYVADDCAILIRKITFGKLLDKITAYVADVYINRITQLVGCVLTDESGSIAKGTPEDVLEKTDALFLINSDFMRGRQWGLYVRNGKLWRNKPTAGVDICTIDKDGIMRVFNGDSFNSEEYLKNSNLWHVITFGPSLLNDDGSPRNSDDEFHITENYSMWNRYDSSVGFPVSNPRTAIGQAEDGHFIFVAVDGRDKFYSKGMTFPELSHFMYEEGAKVAYNLDGGGSVFMYFDGTSVNQNSGGRNPSDYLCILRKE